MGEWLTEVLQDPSRASIVAGWFAAAAVITVGLISAIVSLLVAGRSGYINAVTAERSKWIETLRGTISKFAGAADRIRARRDAKDYLQSKDWAADTEALRTLLADLTLRLNPSEDEARNLLFAAKTLDAAAHLHTTPAVGLANEVMIRHAQWVLKAEWDRVKQEASGPLAAPWFWMKNARRRGKYHRFLRSDGDLGRLEAIGAGKSDAELTVLRSDMDREPPKARFKPRRRPRVLPPAASSPDAPAESV